MFIVAVILPDRLLLRALAQRASCALPLTRGDLLLGLTISSSPAAAAKSASFISVIKHLGDILLPPALNPTDDLLPPLLSFPQSVWRGLRASGDPVGEVSPDMTDGFFLQGSDETRNKQALEKSNQ
jgi:hypothetical protein